MFSNQLKYKTTQEGERILRWSNLILWGFASYLTIITLDFILPKTFNTEIISSYSIIHRIQSKRSSTLPYVIIYSNEKVSRVSKEALRYIETGSTITVYRTQLLDIATHVAFEDLGTVETMYCLYHVPYLVYLLLGLTLITLYQVKIRIRRLEKIMAYTLLLALGIIAIAIYSILANYVTLALVIYLAFLYLLHKIIPGYSYAT